MVVNSSWTGKSPGAMTARDFLLHSVETNVDELFRRIKVTQQPGLLLEIAHAKGEPFYFAIALSGPHSSAEEALESLRMVATDDRKEILRCEARLSGKDITGGR